MWRDKMKCMKVGELLLDIHGYELCKLLGNLDAVSLTSRTDEAPKSRVKRHKLASEAALPYLRFCSLHGCKNHPFHFRQNTLYLASPFPRRSFQALTLTSILSTLSHHQSSRTILPHSTARCFANERTFPERRIQPSIQFLSSPSNIRFNDYSLHLTPLMGTTDLPACHQSMVTLRREQ